MQKKNELFYLIKSLDRNESGYFVKYAKRHGLDKKNDYLWLFEELKKQKKRVDWKAIEKNMPADRFKIGLTKAKRELYIQILKSMNLYTGEHSMDNKIRALITEAVFLRKKGLNNQYRSLLSKAKRLALKYEEYEMVLNICTYEWQLMHNVDRSEVLDTYKKEQLRYIDFVREGLQISYKASRFNQVYKALRITKSEVDREKIDQIMKDLWNYDFVTLTFWNKQIILFTEHVYYLFIYNNLAKATLAQEKAVKLYLEQPHFIKEDPNAFILSYHHVCNNYLLLDEYDKFNQLFSQTKYFLGPQPKVYLETMRYILKIRYYIKKENQEGLIPLIKEVKEWWKEHNAFIQTVSKYSLTLTFAYYYYFTSNYEECAYYANLMQQELKLSHPVLAKISFFLASCSYYKLRDDVLLESTIHKFEYYFKEKRDTEGYDVILLKVTRALLSGKDIKRKLKRQLEYYDEVKKEAINVTYLTYNLDKIIQAEID